MLKHIGSVKSWTTDNLHKRIHKILLFLVEHLLKAHESPPVKQIQTVAAVQEEKTVTGSKDPQKTSLKQDLFEEIQRKSELQILNLVW